MEREDLFWGSLSGTIWDNCPESMMDQTRCQSALRASKREQSKENREGCEAPPLVSFRIFAKYKPTVSLSPLESEQPELRYQAAACYSVPSHTQRTDGVNLHS